LNKNQIRSFYISYKELILKEIKEYLDIPFIFHKINNNEYIIDDDNVNVIFNFRIKYFDNPSPYFNINQANKAYDVVWDWGKAMNDKHKTPQNFLRVLATSYSILNDFINNIQPDVISFSGLTKGHNSIYFGETFINRLRNLFNEEYDIILDKDNFRVLIVNKTISTLKEDAINKRADKTSIQESIIYWKYPHLPPSTPSNVKIKNKIKQRVIKNLYIK
jgi:hypothetical protein